MANRNIYVDLGRIPNGAGDITTPWNAIQLSAFFNTSAIYSQFPYSVSSVYKASDNYVVTNFYLSGNYISSDWYTFGANPEILISGNGTSADFIFDNIDENKPYEFNLIVGGTFKNFNISVYKTSAANVTFKFNNGIIQNANFQIIDTTSANNLGGYGKFELNNCILNNIQVNNFDTGYSSSGMTDVIDFKGCTLSGISYCVSFRDVYDYYNPIIYVLSSNFYDCVFYNPSSMFDGVLDDESFATKNYISIYNSTFQFSGITNLISSGTSGIYSINNCTFGWVPSKSLTNLDNLTSADITFSDFSLSSTRSSRSSFWNQNGMNKGLFDSVRNGPGAFYFTTVFLTVSGFINENLNFAGNNFSFSAVYSASDLDPGLTVQFDYLFSDISLTSSTSIQRSFGNKGIYSWEIYGYIKDSQNNIISQANTSNTSNFTVNPQPLIDFTGNPLTSATLTFWDDSGALYFPGTVVSANWDFGDGNTSATTILTATFEHIYYNAGNYTVSLSAYDISGNISIDTGIISILVNSNCTAKDNYITICGPDMLGRFGNCRNINLTEYLPIYLQGGETEEFLILFQDFLNNMFDGLCGWQTSSTELNISSSFYVSNSGTVSATAYQDFIYNISGVSAKTDATNVEQLQFFSPSNISDTTSAQKISILEKVARLTELHDPSLIDIQYIQFFASNLGYNVNISRDEVGISGTSDNFGTTEFAGECSATDINKYLRFVVENLPTWYKIKTTRNAIKVMLYSFGLVADIIQYFSNDYNINWISDFEGNLQNIPNNWYPTPHFAVYVNFDLSSDISFEIARRQKVVRAIESIRPINTVFKRLVGYSTRLFEMEVACYIRSSRYAEIISNGYSDRPYGPIIVLQPTSMTAHPGDSVTFSIVARGYPVISYQWKKNNINIVGAVQSSYTKTNVQLSDNGSNYKCIVSSPSLTATSNTVSLTVF